MKINRKALIEFFDTNKETNKSHSSSINAVCGEDLAVGLLKHFFEKNNKVCEDISTRVGVPKQAGVSRGKWLDNWLLVKKHSPSTTVELYQVEIKNWSAHSLGGEELALNADGAELTEFKSQYWTKCWDETTEWFKEESVNKVFLNMKRPKGYEEHDVKRLICFWSAVSSNPGENDDYFFQGTAKTKDDVKIPFHVFSLSGYLRTLESDSIDLDLPKIAKRLGVLGAIFPNMQVHRDTDVASQLVGQ
jgi:hypothetical protein